MYSRNSQIKGLNDRKRNEPLYLFHRLLRIDYPETPDSIIHLLGAFLPTRITIPIRMPIAHSKWCCCCCSCRRRCLASLMYLMNLHVQPDPEPTISPRHTNTTPDRPAPDRQCQSLTTEPCAKPLLERTTSCPNQPPHTATTTFGVAHKFRDFRTVVCIVDGPSRV